MKSRLGLRDALPLSGIWSENRGTLHYCHLGDNKGGVNENSNLLGQLSINLFRPMPDLWQSAYGTYTCP